MVETVDYSVQLPTHGVVERPVLDACAKLKQVFGVAFSVVDGVTGDLVLAAEDAPPGDWMVRGEMCREIAGRQTAEVIQELGPFVALGIPVFNKREATHVAVAGFISDSSCGNGAVDELAASWCVSRQVAAAWIERQVPWRVERLLNMAALAVESETARLQVASFEDHINDLSDNLSQTYEEISLLHRIAGNLKISEGRDELVYLALEWLSELLPASAVLAYVDSGEDPRLATRETWQDSNLHVRGQLPFSTTDLRELVDEIGLTSRDQPVVLNEGITQDEVWRFPEIRQLVAVPVAAGDLSFGYLAAMNHRNNVDFGTVEASLMSSVATMLAIHSGNIRLYSDQVQLLSGMLQALVSAIDAKDPYTCGHSNRVARVALRLSQHLECSERMQNTVYLSGLLHDIGKIGIDDQVLRKPGRLTAEEYEHIKLHPELGYKILKDITRIKDVLPGVLHHHEAWDGSGYPHGLAGEDIPYLARILAVADAFDAMGSDRSYREGMPDEKLDSILRDGAGGQWDANVVAAFFAARDEIREISNSEEEHFEVDLRQWT